MRRKLGLTISVAELPLVAVLLAPTVLAGCLQHSGGRSSIAEAKPDSGRRPSVQFVDVTRAAGIDFRHSDGASGKKYEVETMGAGGAFLDYNNDGWLDILLLNGKPLLPIAGRAAAPSIALYRNNKNGTFTDVTKGSGLDVTLYGQGCCVGDYDNDGYDDIYVTTFGEPHRLFHNEGGTGKFRDVTAQAGVGDTRWGTSCAWLDYDRDGRLDLFVCNYMHYHLSEGNPACTMGGKRVYCGPKAYAGEPCVLYHNEGGGRFRDVSAQAGISQHLGKALGVLVWDYDEDGWPDLMVANDQEANFLFHNNADNTFREVAVETGVAFGESGVPRAGMGIDAADYRNNGKAAVLVGNYSSEPLSFFYPVSKGFYSDLTYTVGTGEVSLPFLTFGLFFFDYDNDGWKDAFVANGHVEPDIALFGGGISYAQRNLLFHNRKDGTFEEVGRHSGAPFSYLKVGRGAAYGDYDNDGDLDILVTNVNDTVELLRNEGGNRGHWLQVALKAREGMPGAARGSNRDGIGALVTVQAGGIKQRDWARSGSSYLSQSMLRLHFGLGEHRRADLVEVRWPSGIIDRLRDIPADRILDVEEGTAAAGRPSRAAGA